MREKFRADKEEWEKFRRRLCEGTKIEKRRITKIGYENKENRKLADDSSVKVKLPKLVPLL